MVEKWVDKAKEVAKEAAKKLEEETQKLVAKATSIETSLNKGSETEQFTEIQKQMDELKLRMDDHQVAIINILNILATIQPYLTEVMKKNK